MTTVVALDGSPIANPAEPETSVIVELRELLSLAEAGQITGLAYAAHYYDGVGRANHYGCVNRNTVGQLFAVATRISLAIDREP